MAVKRKRKIKVDDINFKLAEVAEKGQVVVYDRVTDGFVRIASTLAIGDKAAGVLIFDVVDKDFNAVPVNFHKLETGLSGFVRLAKQGELATDQITTGAQFGPGSGVFLNDDGLVGDFADATVEERLGTALSAIDADGFVEVYWDIG